MEDVILLFFGLFEGLRSWRCGVSGAGLRV